MHGNLHILSQLFHNKVNGVHCKKKIDDYIIKRINGYPFFGSDTQLYSKYVVFIMRRFKGSNISLLYFLIRPSYKYVS